MGPEVALTGALAKRDGLFALCGRTTISTPFPAGGMGGCGTPANAGNRYIYERDIRDVPHVQFSRAVSTPVPIQKGTQVGRLVPSDLNGRPASARDVTPLPGQAARSRSPRMTELVPPVRPERLDYARRWRGRG
jgi:hypothetical protein